MGIINRPGNTLHWCSGYAAYICRSKNLTSTLGFFPAKLVLAYFKAEIVEF
jgi:hypothetical protein